MSETFILTYFHTNNPMKVQYQLFCLFGFLYCRFLLVQCNFAINCHELPRVFQKQMFLNARGGGEWVSIFHIQVHRNVSRKLGCPGAHQNKLWSKKRCSLGSKLHHFQSQPQYQMREHKNKKLRRWEDPEESSLMMPENYSSRYAQGALRLQNTNCSFFDPFT